MVKKEIKEAIIPLLEQNKAGMSQKKIAENLNTSRPTVKKYLEELRKEGKVTDKRIGDYIVWVLNELEDTSPNKILIFALKMMSSVLVATNKVTGREIDWKEVGKQVGPQMDFYEIYFTRKLIKISSSIDLQKKKFESIVIIFREIFNIFTGFVKDAKLEPPLIYERELFFIYRIYISDYIDNPSFYAFLMGIIESQIELLLKDVYVDIECNVNQIEEIVDIKVNVK